MDFQTIVNRHNYSPELASFLKQVYDEFVLEFGAHNEEIIYKAFYYAPVVSVDNVYEGMQEQDMDEEIEGLIVSPEDVGRSSGANSQKAIVKYNVEENRYYLEGIRRIVFIKDLDLSKDSVKAVIIHELGHLIKSYFREFVIEGDLLIERSGLAENVYRLSGTDEIKKTLVSEKGIGLEEGLNSNLEKKIARKLADPNYEISGYAVVAAGAEKFLGLIDITEVNEAEIANQKSNLIANFNAKYGDNAYERFEAMMDKLYRLELDVYSCGFNPEKIQAASDKQKEFILNVYWPLLDELEEYGRNGGRKGA